MDNQNQQTQSPNEMDLGNLFSRIGDMFSSAIRSIFRGLANIRRATLENRWLFIALSIIGISSGIVYKMYFQKKYYESSMIISSDYLNKRIVDNSIQKLSLLLGDQNKEGLKTLLNINDTTANNLIGLEARTFIGEEEIIELRILKEQLKNSKLEVENPKIIDDVIKKIEIENQHAFEIKVKIHNPKVLRQLQDGLVQYFKNNDYVKKRISSNREILLERQKRLSRDFERLDSLKSAIYGNFKSMAETTKSNTQVILGDKPLSSNPVEIYAQSLGMYKSIEETNEEIFLQPDFEVVDGFVEVNVPVNQTLPILIVEYLFGAILLGYLFIGFKRFNSFLDKLA